MFSNKDYSNKSTEAIKNHNCLQDILIELQTLKNAQREGYSLMSIQEVTEYLEELKSILEGGDAND